MKTCVATAAAVVLLGWTAAAQDEPKVGAYLGYDYVRFNSATNVPAFSANGGSGQFIYKFNHWLGAVADLGAVNNQNLAGIHADTTIANFLFGPRITSSRHHSRFQPFGQVLFGGVYATTSVAVSGTKWSTRLWAGGKPLGRSRRASAHRRRPSPWSPGGDWISGSANT